MNLKLRVFVAAILFWVGVPLFAQEFTGRISDKSGAVIPNVTVTAHEVDTGVNTTTKSNGTGNYTIPYLKAGHYTIEAAATGFAKAVHEGIDLQVGHTAVINFTLQVGSTSQVVTVNANSVLDMGKADIGEVVENARVSQLPLNGRDPMMLSELAAGVTYSNPSGYTRPFDDTQQNTSINGGGNGNVEMLLDGVSNNTSPINVTGGSTEGIAHTGYTTPVDSVQSFKMITSPYDSQYGLESGGVEDVILKSGTNKLHGSVYEYARRTWLDANTWENDWAKVTALPGTDLAQFRTPEMKWDQYGFELDGPIVVPKIYNGRNKTFFTLQWEHFKALSPLTDIASVPDPAWANGDFSQLDYWDGTEYQPKQIYDPLTAVYDTDKYSPTYKDWVRTQFNSGGPNMIPQSRFSAFAQKIMKLYPKPNVSVNGGRDHWNKNYVLSTAGVDDYNNILAKLDQNWSAKDRFTLRYGYWMRNTTYNGNGLPAPLSTGQEPIVARSHTFFLQETHTFSPTLLVNFKANVIVRDDLNRPGSYFDPTTLPGWTTADVESMGPGAKTNLPQLCWGPGYACYFGSDYTNVGTTGDTEAVKNSLNLMPTVTWIRGRHSIRAGIDVRLWQNGYKLLAGGATITTGSNWTDMTAGHQYNIPNDGNDFASFLLGVPDSASNQIWPQTYQSEHYFAPFVQDDWKITRKLTLNLGLRWDWIPAETERHNIGNYKFDTTTVNPYLTGVQVPGHGPLVGGLTFIGVNGNPRSDYPTVNTDWQPRFGFAYALDSKTVLRGGFGKSMQTPQNGIPVGGFSATTTAVTSDPNYPSGAFPNMKNPFEQLFWGGVTGGVNQPTGSSLGLGTNLGQGGYGVSTINPKYKNPSFWSYSAGFERQFLKNDTINVSYVGTRLYDGTSSGNINLQDNSLRIACSPLAGGDPDNCTTPNPEAEAPNPFYQVKAMPTNYNSSPTISRLDLSRPMPEFGDVSVNDQNDARTWYNSLQITVLHRVSKALTLHGTETWSKSMQAGTWADQYYGLRNRNISGGDMPNRITISGIYTLPVGRGQMLFSSANRIVDTVIGGWQLGSIFIWQSGTPQGVPGYYLQNAKVSRHIQKSNGYIRVFAPFAESYVKTNGQWVLTPYLGRKQHPWSKPFTYSYDGPDSSTPNFMDVPSYAPASVIDYTGMRTAGYRQFDTSFSKSFPLYENFKLQMRLDAFNVLNHPEWTQGADTSTNFDANLGTITKGPTGPNNTAREMQISAKIVW